MENNENQIIALRQNAKADLEQLRSIEDGLVHLNKLKGIEAWVVAQKLDAELHVLVMEQELRTKRIVGKLLQDGKDSGEILRSGERKINSNQYSAGVNETNSTKKSLEDLGIPRHDASTFQKIASIPEEIFEEHIADIKAEVDTAVKKLTTTGAVKLAEQLAGKSNPASEDTDKQKISRRADQIINEVNEMPVIFRLRVRQSIKK